MKGKPAPGGVGVNYVFGTNVLRRDDGIRYGVYLRFGGYEFYE